MTSIIELKIKESTTTSPLKFFQNLYTEKGIELAYSDFLKKMPDLNNPNDRWVRFPTTIDTKNKTWTIEYEVEIDYDEHGGSKFETRYKEFKFETELEFILEKQFYSSRNILKEKISKAKSERSKKDLIRNFIYECLDLLDVIEKQQWKISSHILARGIRSLIRFPYLEHKDFSPDQRIDSRIGDILIEREESKPLYKSKGLLPELADEILKIKDSQGNPSIKYKADTDREKLKLFLSKKSFDLEGGSIKLEGAFGKVYYFLNKIILISGLRLNKAEESKLFMINGHYFVAQNSSNNTSKIVSRNELDMSRIEKVLKSHTI